MSSGSLLLIFNPRRSRNRAVCGALNRKRSVECRPGQPVTEPRKDRFMHTDLLRKVAATDALRFQVVIELCHAANIAPGAMDGQPDYCTWCNCLTCSSNAPCAI